MSLWKIAWRSIQHRSLASSLTAVSMALGVALVVAVLVIHGVIETSFRRSDQGYDLIVGAKGSSLELVLSTVYQLGKPPGNIPYQFYEDLDHGEFSDRAEIAVPICLGDSFRDHRVIGTLPDFFERFRYAAPPTLLDFLTPQFGPADLAEQEGQPYEFAEGRNFAAVAEGKEPAFEAVIGATAARKTGMKLGDTFRPTHGVDAQRGDEHDPFTVVGILKPSGTPVDRGIFVHMEMFYHLHDTGAKKPSASRAAASGQAEAGHDEHEAHDDHAGHDHAHDHEAEKPITAILVRRDWDDAARALELPKLLNELPEVQAVAPAEVVADLFDKIVGKVQVILLIFAVLVVIVAGIGLMVSIYNSMSDRRHEIAVMRALGARRSTVMMIVLLESILLSLGGGALGVLAAHALIGLLSPVILETTGVVVSALHFQTNELILIPGLIVLASLVGYLPAVMAYRTDVAESLTSTP